jgi:type VI secretion system protein VasD
MKLWYLARSLVWIAASAAVIVSACGKAPPPLPPAAPPQLPPITTAPPPEPKVKASMTLEVSHDVNPDANGRPSPVVIHIFQLKGDAVFLRAEFFALMDDPKALGDALISRDEFFLQPGDQRTIDVTLATEAALVGVTAAYREFRTAEWRAIVPAPRQPFTVSVERARVGVAPSVVNDVSPNSETSDVDVHP